MEGPWAIVILGPPSCGKGTQCELLVQKYGLVHVSTGDLLRVRQRDLAEVGTFMEEGRLVPDELMLSVLSERLAEPDCQESGVLLDGFPRTRTQALMLQAANIKVRHVVLLDVPDWIVTERVEGRRIDPVSGRVYHVVHRPPSDPAVRGRLIRRADDTVCKIRTRLLEFHANISGVLDVFRDRLVTIKAREFAVLHGARHGSTTSVPVHSNPEQIFDAIRQHIEGDDYWGTSFRTVLSVKEYECGSSAADMLAMCRFFDHGRMRMLRNGCLSSTVAGEGGPAREESSAAAPGAAAGVSCVTRSQAVQLSWPLVAGEKMLVRTLVSDVGTTSVRLAFELTDRDTGEEVGAGTCVLVYVDVGTGRPVPVPGGARLRRLVASTAGGRRGDRERVQSAEVAEGRGGLVRTHVRGEGLRSRLQERMHLAFGEPTSGVPAEASRGGGGGGSAGGAGDDGGGGDGGGGKGASAGDSSSSCGLCTSVPPAQLAPPPPPPPPPKGSWATETLFTPADVDGDGRLHPTAVMRRAFDAVYGASRSGALGPVAHAGALAAAPLRRYAAEFVSPVAPGDAAVVTLFPTRQHRTRRMVRACFTVDVIVPAEDGGGGARGGAGADGVSAVGVVGGAAGGTAGHSAAGNVGINGRTGGSDSESRNGAGAGGGGSGGANTGGVGSGSGTRRLRRAARGFVDLELSSEPSRL